MFKDHADKLIFELESDFQNLMLMIKYGVWVLLLPHILLFDIGDVYEFQTLDTAYLETVKYSLFIWFWMWLLDFKPHSFVTFIIPLACWAWFSYSIWGVQSLRLAYEGPVALLWPFLRFLGFYRLYQKSRWRL